MISETVEWSDQLEERMRRSEEPMTIIQDAMNQWKEKRTIENREEEERNLREE